MAPEAGVLQRWRDLRERLVRQLDMFEAGAAPRPDQPYESR